jgi:hypothetical protein
MPLPIIFVKKRLPVRSHTHLETLSEKMYERRGFAREIVLRGLTVY